jgi:hypothetical protein
MPNSTATVTRRRRLVGTPWACERITQIADALLRCESLDAEQIYELVR